MALKPKVQMNPEEGGGASLLSQLPDSAPAVPGERIVLGINGRSYIYNHVTDSWGGCSLISFTEEDWEETQENVYRLLINKSGGNLNHGLSYVSDAIVFRAFAENVYSPQQIYYNIDKSTMNILIEGRGDLPFAGYVEVSNF
mgnify:FL=1